MGEYSPDTERHQFVMERRMIEGIRERAHRDGTHAVDVVRSAVAVYLGWPQPYEHPRAARWTKETRAQYVRSREQC